MVKPVLNCIFQILVVSFPLSSAIWNSFPPHFSQWFVTSSIFYTEAPGCEHQGELITEAWWLSRRMEAASPNLLRHRKIFRFPSAWGWSYWNLVQTCVLRGHKWVLWLLHWPAGSWARSLYHISNFPADNVGRLWNGCYLEIWEQPGSNRRAGAAQREEPVAESPFPFCVNSVVTFLPAGFMASGEILSRISCAVLSAGFNAQESGMV